MKDPYLYDDVQVLKNIKGIKDAKILDAYENRMTTLGILKLIKDSPSIQTINSIKQIHHVLFEKVYTWAGEYRTINIYKREPIINGLSVPYSPAKNIKQDLITLQAKFKTLYWEKLPHSSLAKQLSVLISSLWKIHPFREGNTRLVTMFMYLLLKQYHAELNVDFISKNAKYFRNALVMASLEESPESHYIENIIFDSIQLRPISSKHSKYKKIKNFDVENYQYDYHYAE
jgi:cell filamentation protein